MNKQQYGTVQYEKLKVENYSMSDIDDDVEVKKSLNKRRENHSNNGSIDHDQTTSIINFEYRGRHHQGMLDLVVSIPICRFITKFI